MENNTQLAINQLTPKEYEDFKSLVRLGDSLQLAFKTIIQQREIESTKEDARNFYTFAYLG